MFAIKLTQQEMNNLKAFLSRTTLTGNEALEFMKLVDKLENAEVTKDGE